MSWRWNQKLALIAVCLFLVVQLTIPGLLWSFDAPLTPRFGWQMFSTARLDPEFRVVTAGSEREVPLAEVLARPRADLDLENLVPRHLCDTVPEAVRVIWRDGSLEC